MTKAVVVLEVNNSQGPPPSLNSAYQSKSTLTLLKPIINPPKAQNYPLIDSSKNFF